MLKIIPAEASEVTRLKCPECKEKVPYVGIKKDSQVDGLSFTCKRCKKLWAVKTE
jgi:transposase-like protein